VWVVFLEVEKSEFDRTHGFLYLGRADYEAGLENLVKIQFEHFVRTLSPLKKR